VPQSDLSWQLLQLLADTAEAFIVEPTSELDATIDRTLASIGGLFDVDRAYVFSLSRYPGFATSGVPPGWNRRSTFSSPCRRGGPAGGWGK